MKIVILTGNELRHKFFRMYIASYEGITVLKSYCESEENLLSFSEETETKYKTMHLLSRNQSEKDFFQLYTSSVSDKSNAEIIERGSINDTFYFEEIKSLQPDLIIVYGASIIKGALLHFYKRKILNVHLGLSPYYRGAATNFWALVHGKPPLAGATFMYIDEGIDTGEIIHQIRSQYSFFDTPATAGNRLIADMAKTFAEIIIQFNALVQPVIPMYNNYRKFCKKKDFTEESVKLCYDNLSNGMLTHYLYNKETEDKEFPIIQNPVLSRI